MNELLFWERLVHVLHEWETWCSKDFWHKRTRTMLGNPKGPDSHINFWTVLFLLLFLLNSVTCNRFYFCFSALWCLWFSFVQFSFLLPFSGILIHWDIFQLIPFVPCNVLSDRSHLTILFCPPFKSVCNALGLCYLFHSVFFSFLPYFFFL